MSHARLVTSRKNPWFRRFRDAVAVHDEEIALEGPKAIQDAIRLGWKPMAIAVDRPQQITTDAPVIELDRKLFADISDTATSQGMVALFERPAPRLESLFDETSAIIVLDGVQDPGNVGTIIRLAAAFDASGVAITEGTADPFSLKSIRASAGAVLSVPIASAGRAELLAQVRKRGFELWVAAPGSYGAARIPAARVALAFGSEGQGVSAELFAAGKPVSIPVSPRVESLNVAAAAAILMWRLYETRRSGINPA